MTSILEEVLKELPSSAEVLTDIAVSYKEYKWLSVIFHLAFIILLFLWLKYGDKINRVISGFFGLICFSIVFRAMLEGDPFDSITFGIITAAWIFELFRQKNKYSIRSTGKFTLILCTVTFFIGFWYPYLTDNYLFALINSPFSIIECPTLIVMLSVLCIIYPNTNRLLHVVITLFGLLFGFLGTFWLGVQLDIVLMIISLYSAILLLSSLHHKEKSRNKR